MIRALCVSLSLAVPITAYSQTQPAAPYIEILQVPEDGVTVGAPLRVTVNLLAPSYLLDTPDWPSMQIADAITRRPANTSRPGSRRIDGVSWTVIGQVYDITPQRAADFLIPEQQITFSYADPVTNAAMPVTVQIPPIGFAATIPPGAEGLDPFVSATALEMGGHVEGPGDDPQPGASVTRSVTVTAQGTQAMLLPELMSKTAPEGLRAYPRQPDLVDSPGQRGAPDTATRTEAVTYVVEKPGDYTLPGLRLAWWNSANSRIETAVVDPVSFSVPIPPGWHPPGQPSRARVVLPWAMAAAICAVLALWLCRPWWRRARACYAVSEPVLFRKVTASLRQGRITDIRPALSSWLAATGSPNIPPDLQRALREAEQARWGMGGTTTLSAAMKKNILMELRNARRHLLHQRPPVVSHLPPLNPWSGH